MRLRASPANTSGGRRGQLLRGCASRAASSGHVRLLRGRAVAPRRGCPGLGHSASSAGRRCRVRSGRKPVRPAGRRQPKASIGRPRRAGRPIGQEAGRAGGATASSAGAVGVPLRCRPSCTAWRGIRHRKLADATPLRRDCSGSVAASEGFLAHRGHRPLDEPAGGLGGDAELLADLAVAALATVGEAEALLDGVAGPGVEHVEQVADQRLLLVVRRPWPRGRACRRR